MHLVIWIVAALFLALWSLLAWGVAAVLAIDPAWVGDLRPLIDQIPFGQLLDIWVPGWAGLLRTLLDLTQALLGWLGSSAGWLVAALWAAGCVLLLGTAGVCSAVVALVRRSAAPAPAPLSAGR